MKKLFFLPVILLLAMASCKKSSSSSSNGLGTITASIDGTATTFNTSATAVESTGNGLSSLIIIGFQGTAGTSNSMDITLGSNSPLAANTSFSDTSTVGNLAEFAYTTEPGNNSYSDILGGSAQVKITGISSSSIQGTFSGVVTLSGGTPASHTITNGTFNLKLTVQ